MSVRDITSENWRACTELRVTEEQERFVASTSYYLALCHYGEQGWAPLGLYAGEEMIGFAMWAVDPSDGSHWIGGLVIGREHQGRGLGRASMRALIETLRAKPGCKQVALSYQPANLVARALYLGLGFVETGEKEGDEVVARLDL